MKKMVYALLVAAGFFASMLLAACSSGDDSSSGGSEPADTTTLTAISLETALSPLLQTDGTYLLSLNNEVTLAPDFTPLTASDKAYTITLSACTSDGEVLPEETACASYDEASATLTGSAQGSCMITITAHADSSLTKSYLLAVSEVPLTAISLASSVTCYAGRTITLTPNYVPENASYKTVCWESSSAAVAMVDDNGVVTGISEGDATITATADAGSSCITASCTVHVQPVLPTALNLKKDSFIVQAGGSCDIVPVFTPADTTNQAVTYNSSSTDITVDANGLVTVSASAAADATATITVTSVAVSSLKTTATVRAATGNVYIIDDNKEEYGFVSTTGSTKTGDTRYKGYSGSSYLEGFSQGASDSIIYSVYSATDQDVGVLLHYAFWGGNGATVRGAYIIVNGSQSDDFIYLNYTSKNGSDNAIGFEEDGVTPTGLHSIWEDSNEITVHLDAGENQIRVVPVPAGTLMPDARYQMIPQQDGTGAYTTPKNQGANSTKTAEGYLANIDYIQFTGSALGAGSNSLAFYTVTAGADFGSAAISPAQDFYKKDALVTLKATAASGYSFDSWHGRTASGAFVASTEESYTFAITDDVTVAAHYIPSGYSADEALCGYATLSADSADAHYTISGGAGGETLTIASLADLTAAASKLSGDTPYLVRFTNSSRICTSDNKSIICSVGSNKTLYGDVTGAGLKNIELRVSGENVIIRDLVLGEVIAYDTLSDYAGSGNDALSLNGARHVWVDHCELRSNTTPLDINGNAVSNPIDSDFAKDWYDGLLDIKNGATWITVSNCYIHDHYKACLCASGDDGPDTNSDGYSDSDMRVTFACNYWYNVNARQPLFRYGKAHIYGSYFDAGTFSGSASFINCRAGSELYIEGNTFTGTKSDSYTIGFYYADASKTYGTTSGSWVSVNNTGVSSKNGTSYVPAYGAVNCSAPTAAPAGAGAR